MVFANYAFENVAKNSSLHLRLRAWPSPTMNHDLINLCVDCVLCVLDITHNILSLIIRQTYIFSKAPKSWYGSVDDTDGRRSHDDWLADTAWSKKKNFDCGETKTSWIWSPDVILMILLGPNFCRPIASDWLTRKMSSCKYKCKKFTTGKALFFCLSEADELHWRIKMLKFLLAKGLYLSQVNAAY